MPTSSNSNLMSGFDENQQQKSNGSAQATLNGIAGNTASTTKQTTGGQSGVSSAGDRFRKNRGSTPASSQAHSPIPELNSNNKQRTDLNKVMSRGLSNNGTNQSNDRNHNNYPNNQRRNWDNNRMNNNNSFSNYQRQNRNYNNNQMNRRPGYQNSYQNNNFNRQGGFRRNDDRISNHLNNNNGNRNGLRNNQPFNNRMIMRGGRKFVPQSNKRFDATLKTEFDFEKANQVFQEMVDKLEDLNISLNGEKSEKSGSEDKEETRTDIDRSEKVDEDGNFYDKTKSFFDNISCEAIERTKSNQKKFDWKQERKLNAETFGLKVTHYRRNGNFHRPGGFINRNMNQNRRFNTVNVNPQRTAPTNSS